MSAAKAIPNQYLVQSKKGTTRKQRAYVAYGHEPSFTIPETVQRDDEAPANAHLAQNKRYPSNKLSELGNVKDKHSYKRQPLREWHGSKGKRPTPVVLKHTRLISGARVGNARRFGDKVPATTFENVGMIFVKIRNLDALTCVSVIVHHSAVTQTIARIRELNDAAL